MGRIFLSLMIFMLASVSPAKAENAQPKGQELYLLSLSRYIDAIHKSRRLADTYPYVSRKHQKWLGTLNRNAAGKQLNWLKLCTIKNPKVVSKAKRGKEVTVSVKGDYRYPNGRYESVTSQFKLVLENNHWKIDSIPKRYSNVAKAKARAVRVKQTKTTYKHFRTK